MSTEIRIDIDRILLIIITLRIPRVLHPNSPTEGLVPLGLSHVFEEGTEHGHTCCHDLEVGFDEGPVYDWCEEIYGWLADLVYWNSYRGTYKKHRVVLPIDAQQS